MSYLRPELLQQAAAAGRQVQSRPPDALDKYGIIRGTAGEGNQPVAATISLQQVDRTNDKSDRTTKHGGGAILKGVEPIKTPAGPGPAYMANQRLLKFERKQMDYTILLVAVVGLLAFSLMRSRPIL